MPDIEKGCTCHHIKRDLGQHRQQKDPFGVAAQVVGMHISLHQFKGKQREGNAAHIGQPQMVVKHRGIKMVQQHRKQGNKF